jgi:hypothetical protein
VQVRNEASRALHIVQYLGQPLRGGGDVVKRETVDHRLSPSCAMMQ